MQAISEKLSELFLIQCRKEGGCKPDITLNFAGDLEVECTLRKPKDAVSILAGVDRFSGCKNATRRLLATDLVISNYGQVKRTTPELTPASHNFHTNGEGHLGFNRFNMHLSLHGGSSAVLGSNS
ncbi:hypothetical protein TNCV_1755221 [Trichonephila clavipes]|nr:hypothetical protein TNCV_1755221 [Trichonephila clavipes]